MLDQQASERLAHPVQAIHCGRGAEKPEETVASDVHSYSTAVDHGQDNPFGPSIRVQPKHDTVTPFHRQKPVIAP